MARVDTAQEVNLAQLGRELRVLAGLPSPPPLTKVDGVYVEVLDGSVTQAQLITALAVHVPVPEPPPPEVPSRLKELARKPVLTALEVTEAVQLLLDIVVRRGLDE